MEQITVRELAEKLDGRDYRSEITSEECELAKNSGLLVIFGASDDLCCFRGVIDDEIGCWEGGEANIDKEGMKVRESYEYYADELNDDFSKMAVKKYLGNCIKIKINIEKGQKYFWNYQIFSNSGLKIKSFNVYEEGELYGEGIVLDFNTL